MPLSPNIQPDNNAPVSSVEHIKEVQETLRNTDSKAIVRALANDKNRPNTWSRRAVAPYYKERFALQFKAVLDVMMEEFAAGKFEDRIYYYKSFDVSPSSLYLRINQSKLYLLDKLDPDHKYAKFCEHIAITRESHIGIRLSYHADVRNKDLEFKPQPVLEKKKQRGVWQEKIDAFLETASYKEELVVKKLALTQETIEEIETSLAQLDDIIYKIKPDSIFIVKLSKEDVEALNS